MVYIQPTLDLSNVLVVDWETYSEVDIKVVGAHLYAWHPSTEILCCSFGVGEFVHTWLPGQPFPQFVLEHVRRGGLLGAHNATFERLIWNAKLVRLYPNIPTTVPSNWYCTAAQVACLGGPRRLDHAGEFFNAPQKKDTTKGRILHKLSKPDKDGFRTPAVGEDLQTLIEYNVQDIVAETSLKTVTRPMQHRERLVWLYSEIINDRGIHVDVQFAKAAQKLWDSYLPVINARCKQLTGCNATQVAELTKWLGANGCPTHTLEKDHLKAMLRDGVPANVEPVINLRLEAGSTAVKKFKSFVTCASKFDNRVRGTLAYHQASTGRYCLPSDYEVLTKTGWQRMDHFDGQRILTFDPNNRSLYWGQANVNMWDYSGDLVSFRGDYCNFRCTPEHVVAYESSCAIFRSVNAGALDQQTYRLLLSGEHSWKDYDCDCQAKVLVMVQADGHFAVDRRRETPSRSLVFGFKRQRKIDRCQQLLTAVGIPFRISQPNGRGVTQIRVSWCDVPDWLRRLHNDDGSKEFGHWLLDYNPTTVLDEIALWDGSKASKNCIEYSTCSENNAKWIQTLAHLVGKRARIRSRNRNPNWHVNYRVFISSSNTFRFQTNSSVGSEQFDGCIACPETETGFFLCRSTEGSIFVTGNSGKLIQPQNMKRGGIPPEDVELAMQLAYQQDIQAIQAKWGAVGNVLGALCRPTICAPRGKKLIAADFSQVEARGVAWLAGQNDLVQVFKSGQDPYKFTASKIFGGKPEQYSKDSEQRFIGKTVTLGCGYGLGGTKFRQIIIEQTGKDLGEEQANAIIKLYRQSNPMIPKFWYAIQDAAIHAIRNRTSVSFNRFLFRVDTNANWLYITLPSGRDLAYYQPKLIPGQYGDQIQFYGIDAQSGRGYKELTYSGKIVENLCQAFCRDLMVESIMRLEQNGYQVILTVHDELIAEVQSNFGSPEEFKQIITEVPSWAAGFPLDAEAWQGDRYKK